MSVAVEALSQANSRPATCPLGITNQRETTIVLGAQDR